MCRQMCINEAQGTAVSCHSNRNSSFISLQDKKLIKTLIYLEVSKTKPKFCVSPASKNKNLGKIQKKYYKSYLKVFLLNELLQKWEVNYLIFV